jgi:hypothetical protein
VFTQLSSSGARETAHAAVVLERDDRKANDLRNDDRRPAPDRSCSASSAPKSTSSNSSPFSASTASS